MHDHTYRMGICWQNTAYNQPPHLGYYLPDYVDGKITGIDDIGRQEDKKTGRQDNSWYTLEGQKVNGTPNRNGIFIHQKRKVIVSGR